MHVKDFVGLKGVRRVVTEDASNVVEEIAIKVHQALEQEIAALVLSEGDAECVELKNAGLHVNLVIKR